MVFLKVSAVLSDFETLAVVRLFLTASKDVVTLREWLPSVLVNGNEGLQSLPPRIWDRSIFNLLLF